MRKFDAGKRKAAINERSHDEPPVEPTALGPTCLIICPASVVHNWEREFATVRHCLCAHVPMS